MDNSISIIIPTYNRAQHLKKAIDSVLAQSHKDFELIVVDDGSTDNTAELVGSYSHDIIYLKQDNQGPAAARNRGIEMARYNLLAFLDSDDWFAENKLAKQLKAMQMNSTFRISHTNETWFRNGKILNQKHKHKKNSGDIFEQSLQLCAVSMSTVMLKKKVFEDHGLFDEEFPCCEDYEFWLRVSTEEKFLLLEEPLTLKDGGRGDQVSTIFRTGMDKFRIQAIIKILALGRLNDHQTESALNVLEQKCRIYGNGCMKHGRPAEGKYYLGLPEKLGKFQAHYEN